MSSFSITKFKTCLDSWEKQKEKGEQCLSKQEIGQSSKELDAIVDNLKDIMNTMMEEYTNIRNQFQSEENKDNIPKSVNLLRLCVDMYDQEYMVKECIRGIMSREGFATKQHLTGSIALWKSEAYIDEDIINEIRQL